VIRTAGAGGAHPALKFDTGGVGEAKSGAGSRLHHYA